MAQPRSRPPRAPQPVEPVGGEHDPLWYQDAILYQTHVKAFHDSDADGIGDFRGLADKLDYIHDLGVTAIWLLPFFPSPLRDDGYDISDYFGVHPSYGSMADFKRLLREAHRRGLRVVGELVLNHTSDQHPWFQRARRAPAGSPERDFYVWSHTAEEYADARIIFQDFETSNWTWDPVAGAHYWHRFYSHQPDLNFDNPEVRAAMLGTVDYWLELGVDGLRLDAVPYLFEREGTNCENLPETHQFLKEVRAHVDSRFDDRMLLAEANQWPEDAIAYFGDGDECHMAFHFPLMPRLFMALQQEDRFPVIDILQQTPAIPKTAQWAVFLRNHDELTLEMVSDEERDYMYRAYARDLQARINLGIRRRLAPLMGNDRRKIELMNGLLLAMPGTPIVYYGDEIGMGDNIYLGDRDAVRTPMQWSADRNAGFSRCNPQQLFLPIIIDPEYHYETVNVEAQQANSHSLLWWTRRLITLRKHFRVFGRGGLEFLHPENGKVLAFLRSLDDEHVLVVANLSRHAQYVELDLSRFSGMTPVELFGGTEFPPVGELPYLLTLAPYGFYWMHLEPARERESITLGGPPTVAVSGPWENVYRGKERQRLERALPGFLAERRWFGGKARAIQSVELSEVALVSAEPGDVRPAIAFATVAYREGEPETYVLPLSIARGEAADRVEAESPQAVVARLDRRGERAVLYDGSFDPRFATALLETVTRRRRWKGRSGRVEGRPAPALRRITQGSGDLEPSLYRAEQSNSAVTYGDKLILKLFRRVDSGQNPDLEIGRFLTERAHFEHVPRVAGALEYQRGREEPTTVAILQELVHNEGDAWRHTLDVLARFYEGLLTEPSESLGEVPGPTGSVVTLVDRDLPEPVADRLGTFLEETELLGRRTAELHGALAAETDDPAFRPEPFTALYRRSLFQSMRAQTRRTLPVLRRTLDRLPEGVGNDGRLVLEQEDELLARFRALTDHGISAQRIRIHGDYHLGQVLFTGRDFVIIDFEGEPSRPITERRIKRSPLRDVAGMLRSFHYATESARLELVGRGVVEQEAGAFAALGAWSALWNRWVGATFLRSYLATAGDAPFVPQTRAELSLLLDAYLLEKAVYELGYELNNRPAWIGIPLRGILDLLAGP